MPASTTPLSAADLFPALEALDCGVIVLDDAGQIVAANREAASWVGLSAESLVGRTAEQWSVLLHASYAPEALPAMGGVEHAELLRGRGTPKRTLRRERRVFSSPTASGSVETLRDAAEDVQRLQDLERLQERHAREMAVFQTRLEQVEAFKLELTANVTHDLRTPLASIKASVSGLLAGDVAYDPAQLRETLSVIEEETDRLQRRVQNLLSMARMESGAADLSEDWVDMSDVVASALEVLKSLQGGRQITADYPDDLPLVSGDYIQLQIAVRNLIENSLLYSPPETPIEVTVSANLGQVRVRVRDYGSGLMPDEFERVFDKFYRGRSARRIPGTGLGLPICRGIAEAHGGRLWAEHAPGGGVAFVISLPTGEPLCEPAHP